MDQLIHTVVDLILPSLSAIAPTITFTLSRLILNSDLMEKCQKEIDQVVGHSRLATLDDRPM